MRSRVDERLERSERVVGKRKREEKDVKRPREKQNYSTDRQTRRVREGRETLEDSVRTTTDADW